MWVWPQCIYISNGLESEHIDRSQQWSQPRYVRTWFQGIIIDNYLVPHNMIQHDQFNYVFVSKQRAYIHLISKIIVKQDHPGYSCRLTVVWSTSHLLGNMWQPGSFVLLCTYTRSMKWRFGCKISDFVFLKNMSMSVGVFCCFLFLLLSRKTSSETRCDEVSHIFVAVKSLWKSQVTVHITGRDNESSGRVPVH